VVRKIFSIVVGSALALTTFIAPRATVAAEEGNIE
jgi:hypothetical protein